MTWKIVFAISVGKNRYCKHRQYQNLWMDYKVIEVIEMRFLPYLLNICRQFEFSISQDSVATCLSFVLWGLLQILYTFQQCKIFENLLIFDKVTESLKVGTLCETQCRIFIFGVRVHLQNIDVKCVCYIKVIESRSRSREQNRYMYITSVYK